MSWHKEPLVGFDLETTGTDIEADRIVTAAVIRLDGDGRVTDRRSWLLDPGIPIPEQAAAIHGLSTDHVRTYGRPAAAGVAEITDALEAALTSGIPLVVMNARYDLSLLDRECRRYGIAGLTRRLGQEPAPVIDPLVLDKHLDRYRRGKRTLQALCAHYGVALDGAHEAGADALAAVAVARRIAETHPDIAGRPLAALHTRQQRAAAEQAQSFQDYLRRTGNPTAEVDPSWPLAAHVGED